LGDPTGPVTGKEDLKDSFLKGLAAHPDLKFVCKDCGLVIHADFNAAINISRAGHAQLACQANGVSMPPATGTTREAA